MHKKKARKKNGMMIGFEGLDGAGWEVVILWVLSLMAGDDCDRSSNVITRIILGFDLIHAIIST